MFWADGSYLDAEIILSCTFMDQNALNALAFSLGSHNISPFSVPCSFHLFMNYNFATLQLPGILSRHLILKHKSTSKSNTLGKVY